MKGKKVWILAARRNKLARQKASAKSTDEIRIFRIPTLNLHNYYYNLVKWQDMGRTQSLWMVQILYAEMNNTIETAEKMDFK